MAEQVCPALCDPELTRNGSAASRSASANTTCGDLPPSSSVTGTAFSAAAAWTIAPVAAEPVKERWLMPGCPASAAPASLPNPVTKFRAPGEVQPQPRCGRRRGPSSRLPRRVSAPSHCRGKGTDNAGADDLHRVVPQDDVPRYAKRLSENEHRVTAGSELSRRAARPRRRHKIRGSRQARERQPAPT